MSTVSPASAPVDQRLLQDEELELQVVGHGGLLHLLHDPAGHHHLHHTPDGGGEED